MTGADGSGDILHGDCPHCGASMDGGPIPEDSRHLYGPPYRWSRAIGIYSVERDRTVRFECPDCGGHLQGERSLS